MRKTLQIFSSQSRGSNMFTAALITNKLFLVAMHANNNQWYAKQSFRVHTLDLFFASSNRNCCYFLFRQDIRTKFRLNDNGIEETVRLDKYQTARYP